MAVNTSTVTSAGTNGNVTINPNGSGKVVLTKNAGSGNEVVGVDNSGNVQRFRVSGLGAKSAADDADIFIIEEASGTKKKITLAELKALLSSGGGGLSNVFYFKGSAANTNHGLNLTPNGYIVQKYYARRTETGALKAIQHYVLFPGSVFGDAAPQMMGGNYESAPIGWQTLGANSCSFQPQVASGQYEITLLY